MTKLSSYEAGFSAALSAAGVKEKTAIGLAKQASLISTAARTAARWAAKGAKGIVRLPEMATNGASSVLGSRFVGHIPLVRDFGRGFSGAHADWKSKGSKKGILYSSGISKGTLLGNSLYGMGALTAAHPIIGGSMIAIPAAMLANSSRRQNEDLGRVSTLTPVERRIFNRDFKSSGYAGLDGEDIRGFDPFRLLSR